MKRKIKIAIIIISLCILRFLISYNLQSFFLRTLPYDDLLMIRQLRFLDKGKFLGDYEATTLVKGIVFPVFLFLCKWSNVSYSIVLTILYIIATLSFACSIRKIVRNDAFLIVLFGILLFNPISYSSDVFQRMYRNTLSYTELLFFLTAVVNIINSKKNNILNYIFLGLIMSTMLLTREDTIWTYLVLGILINFKLYKKLKIKNIVFCLVPIIVIALNLNIISYINYKHYGVYTYNELKKSHFKQAYQKVLQIKDDEKIDKVAIPKSTFYKLAENSKVFGFTKEEIDKKYLRLEDENGEINNGNIIWFFRSWIYTKQKFKSGEEADKYFENLSNELEILFEEGKLEKEMSSFSTFINIPSLNELKNLPKNLIDSIIYTSTYKNIKAFDEEEIKKEGIYTEYSMSYAVDYMDYHNAENLIENNPIHFEIIRKIYKYFTIIYSAVSLIIYLKNIKIKDKLNFVLHILVAIYLCIIGGVAYTHTTAFTAIRYCYLANIYILQNLFILLNLYRVVEKKSVKLIESGELNDFSNNSSIQ